MSKPNIERSYSTNLNIPTSRTNTPIKVHADIITKFGVNPGDDPTSEFYALRKVRFTIGNVNLEDINRKMANDLTSNFRKLSHPNDHHPTNTRVLMDLLVRDFEDQYATDLSNFTSVNANAIETEYITPEQFRGADGWQSIDSFRNRQLADAQNLDFKQQLTQLPTLNEVLQLTYPDDKNISALEKPAYLDGESITTTDWYKKTNEIPRESQGYHFLTHYFNDLASIQTNQESTKSKHILDEFDALKNKIQHSDLSDTNKSILETSIASDIIQNTDLEPTYCTNSNTVELTKYKVLDVFSLTASFHDKFREIQSTYTGSLSMPNDPDNTLAHIFNIKIILEQIELEDEKLADQNESIRLRNRFRSADSPANNRH